MEHLSVSVVDGTQGQLRQLAGSRRKVGAYLSDVVAWLWLHRETLAMRPLNEFVPVVPAADSPEMAQLRTQLELQKQQLEELGHSFKMMSKMIVITQDFGRETPAPAAQPAEERRALAAAE